MRLRYKYRLEWENQVISLINSGFSKSAAEIEADQRLSDRYEDADSCLPIEEPDEDDELMRLKAENAKFREALQKIAEHPTTEDIIDGQFCDFAHDKIAKEALEQGK